MGRWQDLLLIDPYDPCLDAGSLTWQSIPTPRPIRAWGLIFVWLHRCRQFAVPPFLQRCRQPLGKQGDHCRGGAGAGLQQFHRVGGAAPCRQVWHEAPADASPTGFLTPPGQAATGPRQLLAIKEAAARSQDPKAELASGTGMFTAEFQQAVDLNSHKKATRLGGDGR